MNNESREPAAATGAVATFLTSIYVIINEIWPNLLSDKIQDAITSILVVFVPIVIGFIIRQKVWSPASVAGLRNRLLVLDSENARLKADKRNF